MDDNGKPEVSVALSDFTAFVGFRPPTHIDAFIQAYPDFANLFSQSQRKQISDAASNSSNDALAKESLKSLFGTLIALAEHDAKRFILGVTDKLEAQGPTAVFGESADAAELAKVWKKTLKVYGDHDVGLIITAYLMNLVQLKAGEGCWILAVSISVSARCLGKS